MVSGWQVSGSHPSNVTEVESALAMAQARMAMPQEHAKDHPELVSMRHQSYGGCRCQAATPAT